ncbi:MAG: sugar transferase [Clostridia bacterium]|jgi:O-antigen biosynthesis protein WbqP
MYLIIKRILDVFLSLIALVVILPLFLMIIIAIKADSKGPVFFRQKRIGIYKSKFLMYKFRTMKTDAPKDKPTHLLKKPVFYVTGVGKYLRKTSLDELPQFINILMGQMTLIGPRPALWNQYDLIAARDEYNANGVKPGLTGLAQISGRDKLDIHKKAKLDGEYAANMGLSLDFKCFIRTFSVVLKQEGFVEGRNHRRECEKIRIETDDLEERIS